jgi:hypothetical protein
MGTLFVRTGHQKVHRRSWAPKVHQHLLGETENKSSINAQNEERHPLTTKERPQEAGFFTQKIPFTLLRSKSKP